MADGQAEHSFFVQMLSNDIGKKMIHVEFESMKAIYIPLPDFVPTPIAWGTYQSNPKPHFFMCKYREMTDDMPDSEKFSAQLALLHKNTSLPLASSAFTSQPAVATYPN
ncbi:hypothetical protein H2202_009146 [Exophiala xenobiotica]|nr:hypothetical protein H2202_009146 [Exophiala xenobiotica]